MNKLMIVAAAAASSLVAGAADIYVSLETGKNKNDGTKEAPLKNLWKALEKAETVVDETYETSWVEHAYLEPEAIVMIPLENGGLEMRGDTQNPFFNKNVLCEALCLPEEKVLIRPDTQGGSFGGKCEQISAMAVRAGLAALELKRRHPELKFVLPAPRENICNLCKKIYADFCAVHPEGE